MKKLAVGMALIGVALVSLVWIIPTFAANTHVQHSVSAHPRSVFALEHQVGKAGTQTAVTALTLTCGSKFMLLRFP